MSRTAIAIGTYTRELPHVKGLAKGVTFVRHDTSSGVFELIGNDELDMGDGPSYIAVRPVLDASSRQEEQSSCRRFLVVACNEGQPDELPASITSRCVTLNLDDRTRRDESCKSVCNVGSSGPCHVAFSRCGAWACAATYFGGAVVSVPIEGIAGDELAVAASPACVAQHARFTMADPTRQEKPHAHQAIFSPSGKSLVVCDLGGDCVVVYDFAAATGTLHERQTMELAEGSGPRHAAFHPTLPLLFVLCELSSTVAVFRLQISADSVTATNSDADTWRLETAGAPVSTLPADYPPNSSWCSAICISRDGRLLFAGNRGHDSVAVFRVSFSSGAELAIVSFISGFGSIPRDLALHPDEPILYVASQNDNRLTAFSIDVDSGTASQLGCSLTTPTPVCIVPFLL
jgi:6-phosphogluconolactonase